VIDRVHSSFANQSNVRALMELVVTINACRDKKRNKFPCIRVKDF